ncbi:MAG: hypothetical protein EP330_25320 [Deltaproteobacteria bacterium]|nr:MAG: hypothetical protein EP330_25320 [Deltaproteobacteria bacterium]
MSELAERLKRLHKAVAGDARLVEDLQALERLVEGRAFVHLGVDGVIERCSGEARSRWGMEPGMRLTDAFLPGQRLERLMAPPWAGLGERSFRARAGGFARMRVIGRDLPVCLEVVDVTALSAIHAEASDLERGEALAGFAAAMAAELANPASVVEGRLDLALALLEDHPVRGQLEVAIEQARGMSSSVRALRLVGHKALTTAARSPLAEVVSSAWATAAPRLAGAELSTALEPGLVVGAESGPLSRALSQLFVAIVDEPKRPVSVRAKQDKDAVLLTIERPGVLNGPDPLESRGFAQSVVRGLVGGLGGELRSSMVGERLRIEIRLPMPSHSRVRARRGTDAVLVVGRPELTDLLAPILEPEGFLLEWSATGEDAMERLGTEEYAGVVAELLLDGCSGLALALEQARRNGPPCAVIAGRSLGPLPDGVTVLTPPLARHSLLPALGRRVRA